MKSTVIFVVSLLIGFGLGYLFFEGGEQAESPQNEAVQQSDSIEETEDDTVDEAHTEQVTQEGQVLSDKGCLSCHAVSALNLQGGATGPGLSKAYGNVEGKHGKPIDEYLQEPTSAVMSSVIGGNPLSEEERTQIVEALKVASEK